MEDLQIVEKIGQGSYSTVYKTYKKTGNSKEFVAIKVVDITKLSRRGKEDIVTEIQMLKMLKHKNIVEMLDFKWDTRSIYIIMEYCDGGDLSSFIKKRYQLPERTCQKFLQQLAVGLRFLRSHNISHLDLKPQNLLIVTKPKITLKIGDFGFAQFLSSTTQKSSIRGSPLYMAPEMLLGGKYDARADLWSVGVITYECLFGKAPYSSGSYAELYSKIKSKAPIELSHDVTLSENCKNFLTSLLVHEPEKRMNYETFFNHPFLELDLVPSDITMKKALAMFKEAERLDSANQHIDAFNKYCEGLKFMFPILEEETVEEKKLTIRTKLTRYTKRAEELKCMLTIDRAGREEVPKFPKIAPCSSSHTNTSSQSAYSEVDGIVNEKKVFSSLSAPKHRDLKQLLSLCSKTPSLSTAVEIGVNAQMYLAEGKYELALEKFQSSLGILLPLLQAEPPGVRRDLLYRQLEAWMQQAESAKSLLSMKKNDESQLAAKGKHRKLRNIVLLKFLKKKDLKNQIIRESS